MHIMDDYYLQGCLAKFKQKSFWKENAPDDMYKYDYIIALLMHGFSWAFMVHLPVLFYNYFVVHNNIMFNIAFITIIIHSLCHSVIDDLKANCKTINLVIDQILHMLQIILIWVTCVVLL